jgi:hypothetical protein
MAKRTVYPFVQAGGFRGLWFGHAQPARRARGCCLKETVGSSVVTRIKHMKPVDG